MAHGVLHPRSILAGVFLTFTAGVAPAFAQGAPDCPETISFSGLTTGQIVTSVLADSGAGPIVVQALNPAYGGGNRAVVFDSAAPTGGDHDLGTPNQTFGGPGIGLDGEMGMPFENAVALGKLLIVAENVTDGNGDGFVDDPDDSDLLGSRMTFNFAALGPLGTVTVNAITLLDVESKRPAASVDLLGPGGVLITSIDLPHTGDNGVATVSLGGVHGVRVLRVNLNGSGGIDDLCFAIDTDCNANGIPDGTDIDTGTSADCDGDGVPDECQPDCDGDGVPDVCEPDCDADGIPDDCEPDCDGDGVPDDCEPDCDGDGVPDDCESDCDGDGTPDDCESDCDGDGTPDDCDTEPDCNMNGIPDNCDIAAGTSNDIDMNGIPDECQDCPPQLATETLRLGTPANPASLLFGTTGPPVIGTIYRPVIDHTSFATGSVLDFLAVSVLPSNLPTAIGTLLINTPPVVIFTTMPGTPFEVPIPDDCDSAGRLLSAQGMSFSPGPVMELTNAIDCRLGTFFF